MLALQRCRGSATLNGEGHPIKLLPRQPHSASRHQITMALNYVYEHLCFILICFVHPLARCASSCHFSLGKIEEPTGELISVLAGHLGGGSVNLRLNTDVSWSRDILVIERPLESTLRQLVSGTSYKCTRTCTHAHVHTHTDTHTHSLKPKPPSCSFLHL